MPREGSGLTAPIRLNGGRRRFRGLPGDPKTYRLKGSLKVYYKGSIGFRV